MKFQSGAIVTTPSAQEAFTIGFHLRCLKRHLSGDWGDVEDQKVNDRAIHNGGRIISSYTLEGKSLWVLTEADRSCTTLLLPSDY